MARRKSYNYIGKIIKTGQPLMLVDEKGENFLYFDKLKMLLPIRQSMEKYDVKDFIQYLSGALVTELNGISLNLTLIKAQHACEVFSWLNKIPEMVKSVGRPNTSCEDLFVSYNANNDYSNCPTENFYAYFSDLKQWANSEKMDRR